MLVQTEGSDAGATPDTDNNGKEDNGTAELSWLRSDGVYCIACFSVT